ncbi:MAG: hypothetical protein N3A62_08325 [Thermodesulfovibrionales bacterium]|nr:hypothetical protein [Thermodesulfovibrionales bacterium]
MVIASGYIETVDEVMMPIVIERLNSIDVEIKETLNNKALFIIERSVSQEVKDTLETMKYIEGIRDVCLTYFSLEDTA